MKFSDFLYLFMMIAVFTVKCSFSQTDMNFDEIKVNPWSLPLYFDLRDDSCLSEVKTQPTGGCWSSSTLATVEAWWRVLGLGSYNLSDINLQFAHGYVDSRNVYGNHYMATAYFSRMSGPLIKDPLTDSVKFIRSNSPNILTGARYLPGDPIFLKQTIFDFGPVFSMLNFRKKDVDSITDILYSKSETINHAIVLTGWNDTMKTKSGSGAWIAQNSLGLKFGDSGFFYVPYENEEVLKHNAIWSEWIPNENNLSVHYYDTLGSYESYGFNDSVCYGMAKFTINGGDQIVMAGSFINEPQSRIEVALYSDFNDITKQLHNQIGETVIKHCPFPGYYTVELENEFVFEKKQDVFVVVKYISSYSTEPLPVENYIKDYSDPHITSNSCWINPNFEKWPEAWYSCGPDSQYEALYFDLCIRIITRKITTVR